MGKIDEKSDRCRVETRQFADDFCELTTLKVATMLAIWRRKVRIRKLKDLSAGERRQVTGRKLEMVLRGQEQRH